MERNLTDEEIISRIQRGDRVMFRDLVNRYKNALLNYIARYTGRDGDAEDVLQEAFIRVYRSIDSFDTARAFKPWLYRITTNLCYDYAKKKRHDLSLDKEYNTPSAEGGVTMLDFLSDDSFEPEKNFVHKELLDEIRIRIDFLPDGQKEAFLLFHYEGMPYRDIAKTLAIPVGTVKSRLHNACRRIFLDFQLREGGSEA